MPYRIETYLDGQARLKALAEDVRLGLTATPKTLPPKYFYDAVGSALFDEITRLPEYYLTRVERHLIEALGGDLLRRVAPDEIVDVGAGTATKFRWLLATRGDAPPPARYVPVDVDQETMVTAAAGLTREFPSLDVHGVVGDFERHLVYAPRPIGRRLVAFLGSTMGNLDPPARVEFLRDVRRVLGRDGWFLLGVDLVKDRAVLEAAYNDAAGVTREFNRNVLRVVNRGLDGDFRPEAFRHHAWYNTAEARIEMHLIPATPQTVTLRRLGLTIEIAPGESIWTENSYKFTRASTAAMLTEAGLRLESWLTDAEDRFALVLAAPA